jgi:hypothetical protein
MKIYDIFKFTHLIGAIVFTLSVGIFYGLFISITPDLNTHVGQIVKINSNEISYPPNFLYYFLVNLFSGFSKNLEILSTVAIFLLSGAVTAKYIITIKMLEEFSGVNTNNINKKLITLFAFILVFSFAIPDFYNLFFLKNLYLGRIVPNVWHNSTTIFLFPFALMLFWKQFNLIKSASTPSFKDIVALSLLVVLNALIKPSFLFVLIPVTSIWIILKYELKNFKKILIVFLPLVIGVLVIGILSLAIYVFQAGSFQEESSSIFLSGFFEGLGQWIPAWYIPISLVMSYILPLFVLLIFKRKLLEYKPFLFALFLTLTGLMISALFMESGPRSSHGNFMWQNVICCYLLLLTTMSFLIAKWDKIKRNSKTLIGIKILILGHFLAGIIYLIKIFYTGSFH